MRADKLPSGFQFPIRQRRLKEVLQPYAEAITSVHMSAVSRSLTARKVPRFDFEKTLWAGEGEAVRTPEGWRFAFVIRGVRSDRLPRAEHAAEAVIASDVEAFIAETEALGVTDPASTRVRRLHLAFDVRDGSVHSQSHVYATRRI
jgi:hypothetical protein